jgi:3-hydroxyethyl bacteriochlorophyllide a dehydrogenase
VSAGGSPVVWEKDPVRAQGAQGYQVIDPAADQRRDYRAIYDVSGDAGLIDGLLGRLARGGELVLAGFYSQPIAFSFPVAFMKEARLRVAAEWQPDDLSAALEMVCDGRLKLGGLITHRRSFREAPAAYATAFRDPECLKMLIEWRTCQ